MKIPAFTIRQWISVGLYMLGFVMPAVNTYYNRKYLISFSHFLEPYRWYQWLPFTLLCFLGAAYAWSNDHTWRLSAWIMFTLGLLMSIFSWFYAALNS
jgi:hypothetical protein